MTYTQLVSAVESALRTQVEAAGGKVEVAESLEEAQKALDQSPGRWRVILHWEGFGDHPEARFGMTFHQLATVVQAPRGLAHKPSPISPAPGQSASVSDRIESVRQWMSALRFPDGTGADDAGFALGGSQWLPSSTGTAAHVLNWRLQAAQPGFDSTIPLTFPHLNP